jgi:hypothetical protein
MVIAMACNHCDALVDQPATTEPHAALRGAAVYTAHGSVLERYTCGLCGSVWDRWTARNRNVSYKWAQIIATERADTRG